MIHLRYDPECQPLYATEHSACCDLIARIDVVMPASARTLVPTGVWIENVDWDRVPPGSIPELQIRARSGLAWKHGIGLANGIGTIDADFPDEIQVILVNHGDKPYEIKCGDRIAQLCMNLVQRIPGLECRGSRSGGFGSTGSS